MPRIDWTAEAGPKKPGTYHAEIASSVEREGRESGLPYFYVTFVDVNDSAKICHDIISFSPNAMGMSTAKLKSLGFDKEKTNIEANELVGKRVWISVKIEQQDGYEPRLVVDIGAKGAGFVCGYKPSGAAIKPASVDAGASELNDDIPF